MKKSANYIKAWRKIRGLTQQQLADLIGHGNHGTISKLESGQHSYKQVHLEKIANALNLHPAHLLFDPDDPLVVAVVRALPPKMPRSAR
jgi:transcriptional regulator with XRE-family HTH domain